MTRALSELINGESYNINNPEFVTELGTEIRYTADEIRTKEASPEVVHDLTMAATVLMASEAPPFQKLYPVVEAATITEDHHLLQAADSLIETVYPVDPALDPDIVKLNERSRRELFMARNRAGTNRNLGRAVASAEALHDQRIKDDIDTNLEISEFLMQKQLGVIGEKDLEKLNELLRRREERDKLEALGVLDDSTYDGDTVPYNPFDDKEDSVSVKVA